MEKFHLLCVRRLGGIVINWEAAGALGEIVGAIAVVATLIYLSVQLRQNTVATQSARMEGHFHMLLHWYEQMRDPGISEIWLKGIREFRALEPSERAQFHAMAMQVMLGHIQARNLTDQGLYSSRDLAPQEDWVVAFINTPGGREWWEDSASDWNEDVKAQLELLSKVPRGYVPSPLLIVSNAND